jgi:hypothetical protein
MNLLVFIQRLILNLVSFFLIQLPLQLVGIVVLAVACTRYEIGNLPYYLRWFDSADPYIGRDITVITRINKEGYWSKYCWLSLRNPINYFGYKYLGYVFTVHEKYKVRGSLDVGDSTNDIPGLKIIELASGIYEYLYVARIGSSACFYFRMGHKIGDLRNKPGSWCQQVFTISYRSYSGK